MEQMKFINKDKKHKYIIHNAIKELVTVFEVNFDTPSTQNHGNFRITCWSTYPNCTQRKVLMVQECRIRNTQIRQCPQNIMHSQIHPCDSGNVCIRPKPAPEAPVPRLLGVSLRFCFLAAYFEIQALQKNIFMLETPPLKLQYYGGVVLVSVKVDLVDGTRVGFWFCCFCGGDGRLILDSDVVICEVYQ